MKTMATSKRTNYTFVENKIDNFARASQFWLPLFAVTLHQFSNAAFYGERDGIRPYTLRGHQC